MFFQFLLCCSKSACFWCWICSNMEIPVRPIYLHKTISAQLCSSLWSPKNKGQQMLFIKSAINLLYKLCLTVRNNVSFEPSWLLTGYENILERSCCGDCELKESTISTENREVLMCKMSPFTGNMLMWVNKQKSKTQWKLFKSTICLFKYSWGEEQCCPKKPHFHYISFKRDVKQNTIDPKYFLPEEKCLSYIWNNVCGMQPLLED